MRTDPVVGSPGRVCLPAHFPPVPLLAVFILPSHSRQSYVCVPLDVQRPAKMQINQCRLVSFSKKPHQNPACEIPLAETVVIMVTLSVGDERGSKEILQFH